ncbi:MAG: hypothetical protein ACKO4Q_02280, partial [Planctomycetota bacterium]
ARHPGRRVRSVTDDGVASDLPSHTASLETPRARSGGLREVAFAFLRLGCSSFGGPIAHQGYLRAEDLRGAGWLHGLELAALAAAGQWLLPT